MILIISFVGLAILHLYWAFGGKFGMSAALPELDGVPVFTPGAVATLGVAFVLSGFALIALVLGFRVGSAAALTPYAVFSASQSGAYSFCGRLVILDMLVSLSV